MEVVYTMLVLSRKVGESIEIGPNTRVTVLSVRGGQVKIGIDAPENVKIRRVEGLTNSETKNEGKQD